MKKVFIAMVVLVMINCYAIAQTQEAKPGDKDGKVCKATTDKTVKCYDSKYAKNCKVCKSKHGYYTCGEKKESNDVATTSTTATMGENAHYNVPDVVQDPRMAINNDKGGDKKESKVCKPAKDPQAKCYNTKYNQNFPVCRAPMGYYICGQTPGPYNSTFYNIFHFTNNVEQPNQNEDSIQYQNKTETPADPFTPQNQSYKNINLPVK